MTILLVLAGIGAATGKDDKTTSFGDHRISVPARSGGYAQITGSVTDRLIQSERDEIGRRGIGLDASALKFAIYSTGSSAAPALVFIGGNLAESGTIGLQSPSAIVDSLLAGSEVSDSVDVDSAGLGGVIRCGSSQPRCAWADSSTFGVLVFEGVSPSDAQAAAVQFREDAEQ